jgi:hypothetical protein
MRRPHRRSAHELWLHRPLCGPEVVALGEGLRHTNAIMSTSLRALLVFAAALCLVPGARADALRFNRDIRPILSENCFACHGPDANARKAKLRLDVAEDGPGYKGAYSAIVPREPEGSSVLARILAEAMDERMPPPETEKHISPQQAEVLRRWIAEGAEYEPHWSYVAPRRPEVPDMQDPWVRNPIDAFLLRRMRAAGVEPSPPADAATLARRLHFDLVGLPPAPETVAAFRYSGCDDAYAAMVEELLESPHYGERMAIDWLDQVRYADTNGFHSDEVRSVWPYRDYVIHAFNTNKPFDAFTREQLGGDLMPWAGREQKVAAIYNRLNQLTAEGGAQPKEYIAIYAADRVRTIGSVWLGQTTGCAQCHDHKYDPLTMRDFYRMSAFFADITEQPVYGSGQKWEPIMELPTPGQEAERERLSRRIALLEKKVSTPTPRIAREFDAWLAAHAQIAGAAWRYVTPEKLETAHGTKLKAQPDHSVLSSGPLPVDEVYDLTIAPGAGRLSGIRLEVLQHESFPQGLSRGNGNFVLTEVTVSLLREGEEPRRVALAGASATYEQQSWPVVNTLDSDPKRGWAVDGHLGKGPQAAAFVLKEPLTLRDGDRLQLSLRHESGLGGHAIGRFRVALTDQPEPAATLPGGLAPDLLYPLTQYNPAAPDAAVVELLRVRFMQEHPALEDERVALAEARGALKKPNEQIPYAMATVAGTPRETRVLNRGNWMDESGEVVEPGTPEYLPPLKVSGRRANRLDLAEWLVSPEHPLTARVFVNRLWRNFFGAGLSGVLDDLGSQGRLPANPELLDWLAVEFRESGWDIKHMVRLMVTSSAYRQSSTASGELLRKDPQNLLFARQARMRLEAELVRDNALAIAGLLTPAVGGPSVYPYQPEGYYANCNTFGGDLSYPVSPGEAQYRRGMYTFWKRSFLHPSMLAFDAPSREECTADRPTSNTPLQALVLLNDPTYVEAARVFAQRILSEGAGDAAARIRFAFQHALSREPMAEEQALLEQLLQSQAMHYASTPGEAEALLSTGQAPVPGDLSAPELAAWTSVARAILNLHEVITRL